MDVLYKDVRVEIARQVRHAGLITADGGVDQSARPEVTEASSARLLLCQIDVALTTQIAGGVLVVKIFGFRLDITKQLVALLTTCYAEVSLLKPHSSWSVNDELHVVCKGYKPDLRPTLQIPDPEEVKGWLVGMCRVPEEWLKDAETISLQMRVAQRQALQAALTCTLPSARPERGGGRGRRGQKRGRGTTEVHQRRGRGRGYDQSRMF